MRQSAVCDRKLEPCSLRPTGEGSGGSSPISLSNIEARAAEALFDGGIERARREVEAVARDLAGPDGSSKRQNIVSIELALAHVNVVALECLLGSLLKRKDVSGAQLISRLLADATKRTALLVGAHAGARARPVLVIGHASAISVTTGESR